MTGEGDRDRARRNVKAEGKRVVYFRRSLNVRDTCDAKKSNVTNVPDAPRLAPGASKYMEPSPRHRHHPHRRHRRRHRCELLPLFPLLHPHRAIAIAIAASYSLSSLSPTLTAAIAISASYGRPLFPLLPTLTAILMCQSESDNEYAKQPGEGEG